MSLRKHSGWFAAVLSTVATLHLQSADLLSLQEAEELALKAEPGIEALEAQRAATLDLAVAVRQLPDPTLQLGVLNFPVETGEFKQEPMSQFKVGIKQDFPSSLSLDAANQNMQAHATELQHLTSDRKRMVRLNVRQQWLSIYYELHAEELIYASLDKLRELHEVTQSQYAVGLKDQTGVISIGLEIKRMEDRLLATRERMETLRSSLSRWIQSDAFRPLPLDELEIDLEASSISDTERLKRNPRLQAAEARVEMTESDMRMARSKFKPNLAGELSYSLRDGTLANGASKSDFFSVAIGLRLPIFPQKRQDKSLQAAIKFNSAAKLHKSTLLRELNSRLTTATTRLTSVDKRIEHYRDSIVPQALEFSDAAVASYQSDVGVYKDVIDSQRTALEVQIELIELISERLRIRAEIDYLIGGDDVE